MARIAGNLTVDGLLKDLNLERLSIDPVSPSESRIWFNSTDKAIKFYDGSAVQQVAVGGNLNDYVKHDGTVAMTGVLTLSSADQTGQADTAATSKGYVDTGLATKQATITGAATTITSSDLDVNRAVVSDAAGKISASAATSAEVGYLSGVTSSIQDQIDGKQDALGYVPVNKAGDNMSGNLAMNTNRVTGLGAPVANDDAARKLDIDLALSGLDFQADILDIQVDNTLDPGATPAVGDRFIITDSVNLHANFGTISGLENNDIVEFNGASFAVAYDVSVSGPGALAWDRTSSSFVRYDGTDWYVFGGLAGVTAGVGLAKSGNEIWVNMGAGVVQLPTDEVGLDLRANSGLILTEDGTTPSTGTDAQLAILLNGSSLATGPNGISVAANGIVESMLNTSVAGNGITGGAGSALSVVGDTGINVSASGVALDTAYTDTLYLQLAGGTLTGALTLSGDAVNNLHAVPKQQLDNAVTTLGTSVSNLSNRLVNSFFDYDGISNVQVSHVVTHNIGQKYTQVVVVDSNDKVILPDEITYTDSNSLTVTLNSAEGIRVYVSGLKSVA